MKTFISISLFLVLLVISPTQIEAVKETTKPIIAGTWVSHRGAEHIFVGNTFVCIYIPKELSEYFQKWKGVRRLKNIKKVKDSYTTTQIARTKSMAIDREMDAKIIFITQDKLNITFEDRVSPFTRKIVKAVIKH